MHSRTLVSSDHAQLYIDSDNMVCQLQHSDLHVDVNDDEVSMVCYHFFHLINTMKRLHEKRTHF